MLHVQTLTTSSGTTFSAPARGSATSQYSRQALKTDLATLKLPTNSSAPPPTCFWINSINAGPIAPLRRAPNTVKPNSSKASSAFLYSTETPLTAVAGLLPTGGVLLTCYFFIVKQKTSEGGGGGRERGEKNFTLSSAGKQSLSPNSVKNLV